MKILLIGKNGMLGKDLVKAFHEHELLTPGHSELDITNEEAVNTYFNENDFEFVINAAAQSIVDYCEEHPDEANTANALGPMYLAKACAKKDIPLLQYSTDYVFKGDNSDGYTEDDAPDPQCEYAKSKLEGEKLVQEHSSKHYIVRVCWLFGPGRSNFVDFVAEQAKKEAEDLKIIEDQWGHPCYTKDLAEASLQFLDNLPFGIYHLINEGVVSRAEQAAFIFEVLGKKPHFEKVALASFPWKAHRPQHSIIHNTKLPKLRSWQEAIKEYLIG